jgi:hypothetical protein
VDLEEPSLIPRELASAKDSSKVAVSLDTACRDSFRQYFAEASSGNTGFEAESGGSPDLCHHDPAMHECLGFCHYHNMHQKFFRPNCLYVPGT